jgi:hypothetical protein
MLYEDQGPHASSSREHDRRLSFPLIELVLPTVRIDINPMFQGEQNAGNVGFTDRLNAESRATAIIPSSLPDIIHEEIQQSGWRVAFDKDGIVHLREVASDQRNLVEQQLGTISEQIAYPFDKAPFLRRPNAQMCDCRPEEHPMLVRQAWSEQGETSDASGFAYSAARIGWRILAVPCQTAKVHQAVIVILFNNQSGSEPRLIGDYDKLLPLFDLTEVRTTGFAFNNCRPLENALVQFGALIAFIVPWGRVPTWP